ncbi:hypothetical protein [Scytonema sp. PCC 10023]|uniref:hypothetical protein n=1 Tax=Scytonema sp. PCC 10023 TaxID=1680591 RepID=UPI0039C7295C
MPKRKSEKLWQNAHPEKVKGYQQNYLKDKTQATVVIDGWVVEQIDKVKPPEMSYSRWVREFLQQWAVELRQTP